MDYKSMTHSQQVTYLLNKYVSVDDPFLNSRKNIIDSFLSIDGFYKTELFLKRSTDSEIRDLINWFSNHLLEIVGVLVSCDDFNARLEKDDCLKNDHFLMRRDSLYSCIVHDFKNFSFNGHMNYCALYKDIERGQVLYSIFNRCFDVGYTMLQEDLDLIAKFRLDPSRPMPRYIPLSVPAGPLRCYHCCHDLSLETNGHEVRFTGQCDYPMGYPPWSVEVDFPTGNLAIDDDLRPWFRDAWRIVEDKENSDGWEKYDISRNHGIFNTAKVYADYGCMTGFIGNSCPGIYQDPKNPSRLIIGLPRCVYRDSEDDVVEEDTLCGFCRVGSIVTDLWWYSVGDMVHIKDKIPLGRSYNSDIGEMELVEVPDMLEKRLFMNFIKVPPGRYRSYNCYHLLRECGLDSDEEISRIFVYIEMIKGFEDEK